MTKRKVDTRQWLIYGAIVVAAVVVVWAAYSLYG